MDQVKIGAFLKDLRKEKNMTQEQLAEQFGVAGRTVSRWESGSNMPDLSILIELADFYGVGIRELIDGERKGTGQNSEMKDTLKKVAQYSEAEHQKLKTRMRDICIIAEFLLISYIFLESSKFFDIPDDLQRSIQGFVMGAVYAVLILNSLYLNGMLDRLRQWKLRIFKKK